MKTKHLQGNAAHGRTRYVKSSRLTNTGVVGITENFYARRGARAFRCFIVTPHRRRFNIDRLGRTEAWRRALALRASHEAAILPAQLASPRSRLHAKGAAQ